MMQTESEEEMKGAKQIDEMEVSLNVPCVNC